jgi:hypothetical protein
VQCRILSVKPNADARGELTFKNKQNKQFIRKFFLFKQGFLFTLFDKFSSDAELGRLPSWNAAQSFLFDRNVSNECDLFGTAVNEQHDDIVDDEDAVLDDRGGLPFGLIAPMLLEGESEDEEPPRRRYLVEPESDEDDGTHSDGGFQLTMRKRSLLDPRRNSGPQKRPHL